jgi:alkane 1-monooxygenase
MKTKKFMPIFIFATAALMPTALFGLGLAFGGLWAWAGFIYIAGFAALMDRFGVDFAGAADDTLNGDWLLVVLAGAHLLLLPLLIAAIVIEGPMLPRLGLFLGAALWLGQISNPMAHELIHRGSRALFWLGAVVFSTLGFGHHTSAHRLVHHRFAASPHDPNTARSGEGFYAFFLRAWGGSFYHGLLAENKRRARIHPYAVYLGISTLSLCSAAMIVGAVGVLAWLMLCLSAQAQLLLSDYVQHYGLLRRTDAEGRLEPVSDRHSWNAPFWFSSAMMLNAPRHSDHHAHPARPYAALRLPEDAPRLPWPLPLACTIALVPPIWKRRIRPHLKPWLQ